MSTTQHSSISHAPESSNDHQDYLILFAFLFFGFGFIGYFLYISSKRYMQANKDKLELKCINSKYSILLNLTISNGWRCASIVYIVLVKNKTDYDILSWINFFVHIIPSLMFIAIFFSYIQFLIEKYYELKTKKNDIFFAPSLNFFTFLLYAAFFIITISCLTTHHYKTFYYITNGLVSMWCLIWGILYLYYGWRIANCYAVSANSPSEKESIYNKILMISSVIGGAYWVRGIITFFISLGWFGKEYPTFMNINVWDCSVFFFTELWTSVVIGFTKKEKRVDEFMNEIDNYKFNSRANYKTKNKYEDFPDAINGNINNFNNWSLDNYIPDWEDPLLAKFESEN